MAALIFLVFLTSAELVNTATLTIHNLTETVFLAPGRELRGDLRDLQDTFQPYSALRNAEEGRVTVMYEVSLSRNLALAYLGVDTEGALGVAG